MGWCSGSEIYGKVIEAAEEAIPDVQTRVEFHKKVIDAFEMRDWDCQDDCVGQDPAFDEALKFLHPDWFDDEPY